MLLEPGKKYVENNSLHDWTILDVMYEDGDKVFCQVEGVESLVTRHKDGNGAFITTKEVALERLTDLINFLKSRHEYILENM